MGGRSAAEPAADATVTDPWEGVERTEEFKRLVSARWRFVLPATVFFLVYYFLLPILNGTATDFMRTKVFGEVNIAYLFALSQFVMAWLLAFVYIRQANNVFDPLATRVIEKAKRMLEARRS
jgi:uncharacterized membrane protein (DUF485 family)